MAKTLNKDIDIFNTLRAAQKAFDASKVPCQLLHSTYNDYFIDRSKTAIHEWPQLYKLIKDK